MQCRFNVTLWSVGVTVLQRKHNSALVCVCVCVVVELQATVICIKILNVAQQRVSSNFLPPATMLMGTHF